MGDDRVHRVRDLREFYRALGYTEEIRRTGVMPDEFIWLEYIKDDCHESAARLQAKIIKYLSTHSATFRERYGDRYEGWLSALAQ